jgi:hypothetical protein
VNTVALSVPGGCFSISSMAPVAIKQIPRPVPVGVTQPRDLTDSLHVFVISP